MRATLLLFLALPSIAQVDRCELEAVDAWNRFAQTSDRYLTLRKQGIRNAKERARLERQFAEVLNCECF